MMRGVSLMGRPYDGPGTRGLDQCDLSAEDHRLSEPAVTGSGRRIMRNPLTRPATAASRGTSSAPAGRAVGRRC